MIPCDNDTETNPTEAAHAMELQEQPGGRISTVGGVPFAASSVQAETDAAFSNLWTHAGWLGPLLEAAIIADTLPTARRAAYLTPWGNDTKQQWTDRERHDAYLDHIQAEIAASKPWLMPLLDAACASVVVAPVGFCFSLAHRPGVQWDVDCLTHLVALTPFAEDDEIAH